MMRFVFIFFSLCTTKGLSFTPVSSFCVKRTSFNKIKQSYQSSGKIVGHNNKRNYVFKNNAPSSLCSSATDENDEKNADSVVVDESTEEDATKMTKKIASRKKRVVIGYNIASIGYAFFAITGLVKYKFSYMASFISAGIILPAAIAFILKGAAEHDRLSSDTYKRLNLALGSYSLIGLVAKDIITTFHPLWVITCFVGMVNSIKGYGYGLKGWTLKEKVSIISEFMNNGAKPTFSSMVKIPTNVNSAAYQVSTFAFLFWKLSLLKNIINVLTSSLEGAEWLFQFTPLAFRYKKVMLLTAISYTLKDAADRDRLDGATFIQLNALLSVVSAVLGAYYLHNRSSVIGGVSLAFNSVFTAFNCFLSLKKKNKNNA